MAGKYGMQSLGTYGETQTHAILKPTLTAVPSLLYPASTLSRRSIALLRVNLGNLTSEGPINFPRKLHKNQIKASNVREFLTAVIFAV
jgi:hypothetical protein